jgi:5-methyltetrahydropteroyltriglutamate--homocysteine methyltransferase
LKTSQDRILTTHVGSLPRSQAVVDMLQRRENEVAADPAAFDAVMRAAVADTVKRQVDLGIDAVSDGETSKISYSTYVRDRLTGFSNEGSNETARPHLDLAPFPELRRKMALATGPRPFKRVTCVGPIKVKDRTALEHDLENMRRAVAAAGPAEAFLNAASPGVVATFLANEYYPTHEAYIEAVADAMRDEYEAIARAGFVLQVDCPDLAMARHTTFQALTEAEFLKRARFHVEALNHALAKVPASQVRIHVCWGNYEGPHHYDLDLAKVASIILGVNATAISVEAANPRHDHEWAVWKDIRLPSDKVLLPGVVDTSTNYVEHPDLVAQRILRYAEVVGRERVIASSDCGFGTFAGYGKIDPEVSWLKLGALVDGARRASRQLWS